MTTNIANNKNTNSKQKEITTNIKIEFIDIKKNYLDDVNTMNNLFLVLKNHCFNMNNIITKKENTIINLTNENIILNNKIINDKDNEIINQKNDIIQLNKIIKQLNDDILENEKNKNLILIEQQNERDIINACNINNNDIIMNQNKKLKLNLDALREDILLARNEEMNSRMLCEKVFLSRNG